MPVKYTKDDCVKLLIEKQEFLASRVWNGTQTGGLSPEEVVAIKAFWVPGRGLWKRRG